MRWLADNVGLVDFSTLARRHHAALAPCRRNWLHRRLSEMGLAFGHERDPVRTTAWLTEMLRLLADLPADILAHSIDEAIKASSRGFMPAVGEIRAIADPLVASRRREASRLEALAAVAAGGQPSGTSKSLERAGDFDPADRCTPAQMAKILAELGLSRAASALGVRWSSPPRVPTEDDYRELLGAAGYAAWKAKKEAPPASPSLEHAPSPAQPLPECAEEHPDAWRSAIG